MAKALAAYLDADRHLMDKTISDDSRKAWEAIKAAAYSIVFFGE